ncbi:MAG: hypothetical protein IPN57_04760 [Ignavibacteria bacterium]|nr:hypothetical protein [Ignavibacteria bacterium]
MIRLYLFWVRVKKIIKDLFFSGHTSTAFMLFQIARNKFLKGYFLIATITVSSCVILQKAHYAIDVFAGLVFSYTSYQLVKSFHRKFKKRFKAFTSKDFSSLK